MNYIDIPKQACFTPLYSPRTGLNRLNAELDRLSTNLAINIDKYILGFFKDAFQENNNELQLCQFIAQGMKHLKSWQKQLSHRNIKMLYCLQKIFQQADSGKQGKITWTQFNSMLIEKGLNLKSLRTQEPSSSALMKQTPIKGFVLKHGSPIQKMITIGNKIALFTEESSQVQFFNYDGSHAQTKPITLAQQALTVQTSISKKNRQGNKQTVKKDVQVAQYRNILLDMIYIRDSKYDMILTSSTDNIVRGWDLSANIPVIAKQPQNQDQKMQHQFQHEVHTMAWDSINQVLYCCGKGPKIYQWMVKTDSQRQLSDPQGHTEMISAMIMMPKLQFLATGGFDGKLILWDTISQTKKFKYKQHNRSISSMAFHDELILLFTAAFDHSICVWNPYIQSLVHKIINPVNFIQLDLIPNTNLLIALDSQANVKIREISKFTLLSSFSIDKHDHKLQPSCMIATTDPLRYYFGGLSVNAFDFLHVDANVVHESTLLSLGYQPKNFTLYCPVKNHILLCDLLTGTISNTLRNQSIAQITAFQLLDNYNIGIIGDYQGNVSLRKLDNGVIIKNLYRHHQSVSHVFTQTYKSSSIIFSVSTDGEIAVCEKDINGDFNLSKVISIKKLNITSNITAINYQSKRNTLFIGTNSGQIYFLDIDKNKLVSRCQTYAGQIQKLFHLTQDHILLAFTKKAQIFGLFLPPHAKKFKNSCHLATDVPSTKISSMTMSLTSNRCFMGFQNGDLMCFILKQQILTDSKAEQRSLPGQVKKQILRHIWKNNLSEAVRNITLIESQGVLVIIVGANNVMLLSCEDGQLISQFDFKNIQQPPKPIMYLDQQKNQIYIKQLQKTINVYTKSRSDQVRQIFDPYFYIRFALEFQHKLNVSSNINWKFSPNIEVQVNQNVIKIQNLLDQMQKYQKLPKKLKLVKVQSQPTFNLNKAIQLHKKWQKHKEQEDAKNGSFHQIRHQQSLHNISYSLHHDSTLKSSKKFIGKQKQKFIPKSNFENNNPLYRLGLALMSINQKDAKARQLLQLADQNFQKYE